MNTHSKIETSSDEDIEAFLEANHDEVAAKLEEARLEIENGKTVPFESLEVFLAEARRRTGIR